jgi:putative FmdB family regulatory protein
MPRYDYKCKVCGAHEVIAHGFHDEGDHDCFDATCNGTMQKVYTPTAVIFNAPGFYKTDNR